jgi:23S rRNA pseudouridine1911/1915/1917 synthase
MGNLKQEVSFYPNHVDGERSVLAAYSSIFEFFLGKKTKLKDMEAFVGFEEGKVTMTLPALVKMVDMGLDIRVVEPFDYRRFASKGREYLEQMFTPEKVDWYLENTDIMDIKPQIAAFLRTVDYVKDSATIDDIDGMLTDGRLILVTVNRKVLNNEAGNGENDHAVLVVGRERENYIVHDPGPKPQADRRVSRQKLIQAMGGEESWAQVTGFKLQSKASKRLDQYIVTNHPRLSRAFIQKLCNEGKILVNGEQVKPGFKLRDSDNVEMLYDEKILDTVPDIDLPVIYEDEECVVINKPAGVLTHVQGEFSAEATVSSFLKNRGKDITGERAGIAHRLDRATSGVIIGAKTLHALAWLQKQFARREAKKTYIAVVQGHLKEPEAIIDMPIQRNPKAPATHRVGANGKSALTRYKVLKETDKYSLVELKPETGRTHQLRVHMAHIGHPIVGDPLYGKGKYGDRLYLHAANLQIMLPDGEVHEFSAPVPPEFAEIMQ